MWSRPLNWSTARIWTLEAGGHDEPGVIWSGTLPGGLFRSTDRGQSWEMIRALWDHPKRKQWMGGGADLPGIHSICVDPHNSRRVWAAVSTGGIWFTEDAGASWAQRGEGMRAEHVPPELVWVAEVESGFNRDARSPVGAAGLFQLMPATAAQFGARALAATGGRAASRRERRRSRVGSPAPPPRTRSGSCLCRTACPAGTGAAC